MSLACLYRVALGLNGYPAPTAPSARGPGPPPDPSPPFTVGVGVVELPLEVVGRPRLVTLAK